MSPFILEFRELPDEFERSDYLQLFSKFGTVKKLFIDREFTFGKVYYETIQEALLAYEEVHDKPPLHLILTELFERDRGMQNKKIASPITNQVDYHKYYDEDVEGCVSKFKHVDVFGRLVTTFEGEDGEIYVSLSELKKSGFELYQAGTLPSPGVSKNFDEQLLYQFQMYLKMKATKFIVTHKLDISSDCVNRIIDKEINPPFEKASDRSVKFDPRGLLKITTSSAVEPAYSNRNRMSLGTNESQSYNKNGLNLKSRVSLPGNSHSYQSSEQRLRNNSFVSDEHNGRLPIRKDNFYSSDESISRSCGKSNQRGGLHSSNDGDNRYNRNKKTNSINDSGVFQKPMQRGYNNSIRETPSEYNFNKNSRNTCDSDTNTNRSAESYGQAKISNEIKPLLSVPLNRNAPQKEQNGTYHVQVKESPAESQAKEKTNDAADNRKETLSSVTDAPTTKLSVSFANETTNIVVKQEPVELTDIETKDNSCNSTARQNVANPLQPAMKSIAAETNATRKKEGELEMDNAAKIPSSPARKCVVDLCTSDQGIWECITILGENTFIAFVFPNAFSTDLCELETITEETEPLPNFKPNIGDLVAVLNESNYVRGTILRNENGKYTCALVDFGTIIVTEDIRPLPDKFMGIPEFSCLCKTNDGNIFEYISLGDSNNMFTITSPGKLTLLIESAKKEFEIVATKWNPFETSSLADCKNSVKTSTLPVAQSSLGTSVTVEKPVAEAVYKLLPPIQKLNDRDIVIIVAEQNGQLLLRTKDCNTSLKNVNRELSNYKGKPFEKQPEVGQLAIASFNENSHYRIHVLDVRNDNATVEFIDYGNSDTVSFKMLFTINEQLARMDNTLIKVNLLGVDAKFSDNALKILGDCSSKKEKFVVVHTGTDDEYDLLFGDQSSLSEKLKAADGLFVPKSKLADGPESEKAAPVTAAPTKFIKIDHLPPPKFEVGNNNVMCMYTGDLKSGNVSFCLNNNELPDLLTELQLKITEHVATATKPYEPEVEEVCLAKFLDEWYRACVIDKKTNGYHVLYIDYGNSHIVSSNDICKLPMELAKIEPLALMCTLQGEAFESANGIDDSKLLEMQKDLQENTVYDIDVNESVDGLIIITIPRLYEKWKKQGIL